MQDIVDTPVRSWKSQTINQRHCFVSGEKNFQFPAIQAQTLRGDRKNV